MSAHGAPDLAALLDGLADALAERVAAKLPAAGTTPPQPATVPLLPPCDAAALLSIDEAARAWCCSRRMIDRLIDQGSLRWVPLGSDRRIPVTELRAYVQRHLDHPSARPGALRVVRRPSQSA